MSCTPPNIESSKYCHGLDASLSGWKERVILIPASSIESGYEVLQSGVDSGDPTHLNQLDIPIAGSPYYARSESVKNVRSSSPVILKAGKGVIYLDVIPESVECNYKSVKGGFIISCKLSLQNNLHNRGLVLALKSIKFMLAIQQNAHDNFYEWIGNYHGGNQQRGMVRILKDGIEGLHGSEYDSSKSIDLTMECFSPTPPVFTPTSYEMLLSQQEFTTIATAGTVGTGSGVLVSNDTFQGDQSKIFKIHVGSDQLNPPAFLLNSWIINAATGSSGTYSCFNILANGSMYWKGGNHSPQKERIAGEKIIIQSLVF